MGFFSFLRIWKVYEHDNEFDLAESVLVPQHGTLGHNILIFSQTPRHF